MGLQHTYTSLKTTMTISISDPTVRLHTLQHKHNVHLITQATTALLALSVSVLIKNHHHIIFRSVELLAISSLGYVAIKDRLDNDGAEEDYYAIGELARLASLKEGAAIVAAEEVILAEPPALQPAPVTAQESSEEFDNIPQVFSPVAERESSVRNYANPLDLMEFEPTPSDSGSEPNKKLHNPTSKGSADSQALEFKPTGSFNPTPYTPDLFDWSLLRSRPNEYPHICVVASSGSGKTTLQEWIARLIGGGGILTVITTKKETTQWAGLPVVGLGKKYAAINRRWLDLNKELNNRCSRPVDIVQEQEPQLVIAIDELNDCIDGVPNMSLASMARSGREVRMRLVVNSHTATVGGLGLANKGDLRSCFTWIRLGTFAVKHAENLLKKGKLTQDAVEWLKSQPNSYQKCLIDDQIALVPQLNAGWQGNLTPQNRNTYPQGIQSSEFDPETLDLDTSRGTLSLSLLCDERLQRAVDLLRAGNSTVYAEDIKSDLTSAEVNEWIVEVCNRHPNIFSYRSGENNTLELYSPSNFFSSTELNWNP